MGFLVHQSGSTITINYPVGEVFHALIQAGKMVGKVIEESNLANYVVIRTRMSFFPPRNPANVRVTLKSVADTQTEISISSDAFDGIIGVGSAGKAIDQIIKVLERVLQGHSSTAIVNEQKAKPKSKLKAVAIIVVGFIILGVIIGKPKDATTATASSIKTIPYNKGIDMEIALNNLSEVLQRQAALIGLVDGKNKDQCFDLVYMYWQDFEQRFNQGKYVYSYKFEVPKESLSGTQEERYVSIGQLPKQLCGIDADTAEGLFQQRRLMSRKLDGAVTENIIAPGVQTPEHIFTPATVNSAYPIDPAIVTLQGRLVSAPGETPDGEAIRFPALQLSSTITVQGDQDHEAAKDVDLMNMVLDSKTRQIYTALLGKMVLVKGKLFHRDVGTQHTWVLITPIEITPIGS